MDTEDDDDFVNTIFRTISIDKSALLLGSSPLRTSARDKPA